LHGPGRARIVIVGCGFGGLFAARRSRALRPTCWSSTATTTTCFSRCCTRSPPRRWRPADIAQPIRTILRHQKNARVMLAEVQRVDLEARCLEAAGQRVPYDYLLLAPGRSTTTLVTRSGGSLHRYEGGGGGHFHPLAPAGLV